MASTVMIREFSFGTVMSGSFSVLFRNLIPFLFFAILLTVPGFLFAYLMPVPETQTEAQIRPFIAVLIDFVCATLVSATLVYGTVQELRGRHASIGASIGHGLSVILPALGVTLVIGIGIALGMILLIVPGLILVCMWWVAVPVAVVERPGVFASIGRSAELTKGSRWTIFGIFVVVALISGLIVFLLGVAMAPAVFRGSISPLTFFIIDWLVGAAFSAFSAVLAGVGYFALRVDKEGADIDQLAEVFE